MKLAKIMLFCLFAVITTAIISCNQEQEDPALYGIHKYQKDLVLETPEGLMLDITVSGNDEAIIDAHTGDFFTVKPIYEIPQTSSNPNDIEVDPQFDGEPLEEEPDLISVTINKRTLPTSAVGYTITENDNLLRWDRIYSYNNSCDCGFVEKTNSDGKTKVKIGIKTSSGQWFYNQLLCSKLKSNSAVADVCYTDDYYVMRVRSNDKYGSESVAGFYNLDNSDTCE